HHVDLRELRRLALAEHVGDELLGRERVRVLLLPRRGEGAELALHATDVRLVQIQVLDEVDVVRAAAQPPREVGELPEQEQVVGLEDRKAVLELEALAGVDLPPDLVQDTPLDDCHYRSRSMTMCVRASSSGWPSRKPRALPA